MMKEWRKFGIPSIVTTDQGSHFVSEWWKSMCAELGIRHAYAQGYHHQSNGRAEVAGKQLQEMLRKVVIENELIWVEALPRVVDRILDTKGQAGLTPYEILFGRPRPLANLPYNPPKECEDANQFFTRMSEIDLRVAKVLNKLHKKAMKKTK
jgi:transposase InsO family protein